MTPADIGPFVAAATATDCEPRRPACAPRAAARSVVKATQTVVRPGRKKGGTTVVFRLSRPAVLDITVARVYPTCKRVGSFSVRARTGTNRIRFRGRLRGRPLPEGGYRLVVRARGATRDVAAIPIVITHGPVTVMQLRRMKTASVCTEPITDFDAAGIVLAASTNGGGGKASPAGAVLTKIKRAIHAPFRTAARTTKQAARTFGERIDEASDEPVGRMLLTLIGAIALVSSILGALVLARIARAEGFTVRRA